MSRELTHAIAALKINCPPNLVEIVRNLEAAIRTAEAQWKPPVIDPRGNLAQQDLTAALEKITFYPRETQTAIGNQAAALIRLLDRRVTDACWPASGERRAPPDPCPVESARAITNGLLYTMHPHKKAEPTPIGNTSLLRPIQEPTAWPKFMKFAEPNTPEKDKP
jgi:hypothetical protein